VYTRNLHNKAVAQTESAIIFLSDPSSLLITARLLLFPRLPISGLLGTTVAFGDDFKVARRCRGIQKPDVIYFCDRLVSRKIKLSYQKPMRCLRGEEI
jgi:hypothetical protein